MCLEGELRALGFIVPIAVCVEEVAEVCPALREHKVCVEPGVKLLVCFEQVILPSLRLFGAEVLEVKVVGLEVMSLRMPDAPRADHL